MKTHISDQAGIDAGEYITQKIFEHSGESILLLLSGGSAFSVFDAIDSSCLTPQITIGFVDDRFTQEAKGNSFMQLEKTIFYTNAKEYGVSFINSKPEVTETHHDFCTRIQNEFELMFSKNPNMYTIALFGIGEDGHTASLFPSNESEFYTTYKPDALYAPIYNESLTYPYRGTITPQFIEEKIDDVVLFAVGSNKCDNILNYMHYKNFAHHQIPALIPAQHPHSILFTDCATLL